jgi:hypothetical protein
LGIVEAHPELRTTAPTLAVADIDVVRVLAAVVGVVETFVWGDEVALVDVASVFMGAGDACVGLGAHVHPASSPAADSQPVRRRPHPAVG